MRPSAVTSGPGRLRTSEGVTAVLRCHSPAEWAGRSLRLEWLSGRSMIIAVFANRNTALAIFLPELPRADLIDLIKSAGSRPHYRSRT